LSLISDIADAVAAELAAGTFSMAFTPQRRVLPEFELADLTELKVTVVPKSVETDAASRTASQYDVRVDIGIQRKLDASGADLDNQVAELLGLVDEIAEHLRGRLLNGAPWARWTHTANDPVYAPDHLAERRVFTSVLTVTYRAMK